MNKHINASLAMPRHSFIMHLGTAVAALFILLTWNVDVVRAADLPMLTVTNSLNVPRKQEPVSFGVPFAESAAIQAGTALSVVNPAGAEMPVQLTPLATWSSGSVKWGLVDFIGDVPPFGKMAYQVVKGTVPSTPVVLALSVTDQKTYLEVDTGPLTVRISRERFSGFERVLRDLNGDGKKEVVVAATQDAGLRYVEDGVTVFTTQGPPESVKVEYTGPLHALVTARGWFTVKGRSEYLYYVARYHFWAGHDVVRMTLTLTDRHDRPAKEGVWDKYWDTQRVHDLAFVVTANPDALGGDPQLWSGEGAATAHEVMKVLYPHSHSRNVIADGMTIEGRIEIAGVSGSPNEWMPSADERYLSGWKGSYYLSHAVQGTSDNHVSWIPAIQAPGPYEVYVSYGSYGVSADYLRARGVTYEVTHAAGVARVVADQTPIGGNGWRSLGTFEFVAGEAGRVRLLDTGKGTVIADGVRLVYRGTAKNVPDITLLVGMRPLVESLAQAKEPCGAGFVGAKGAVAVGLSQCWQNYPSALTVARSGQIRVDLLPGGPHHFMGGMGKTWDLSWVFKAGADGQDLAKSLERESSPLLSLASSAYYAGTGAFSQTVFASLVKTGKHSDRDAYEQMVTLAVKSMVDERSQTDAFGWRNYGDYLIQPSYGAGVQDWANNQHFQAYGALVQYLRTGDARWWLLGESAIRHTLDIDFVKFHPFREKYNGTVHRKGDCPPPHTHVCQEPILDMGFAPDPAFLYYHLTGDPWWKEVGMMGVDAHRNFVYGEFGERALVESRLEFMSSGARPTAWFLRGLLSGYAETHRQEYLDLAKRIVERLLARQDPVTGAVVVASVYGPAGAPSVQPQWLGWTMDGLIQYYEITRDRPVRDALVKLAQFIRDYTVRMQDTPADDWWRGQKAARYVLYLWTYERIPSVQNNKSVPVTGSVVAVDADSLSLDSDSAAGWSKAENYRGKRLLIVSGAAKGKSYIVSGGGVDSQGRPLFKAECVSGMPKLCADRAKKEDFVSIGIRSGDGIKVLQYYEYDDAASIWTTLNGLAFATKETGDASFMNEALLNFRDSTNAHLSRSRFGGTAVAGDYLAFPFYFLQCLGGG